MKGRRTNRSLSAAADAQGRRRRKRWPPPLSALFDARKRNKLCVILPDRQAEGDGLVRVIDEDGEDYLCPADWFVAVDVPKAVQLSLRRAS